jgi:tRNA (uracil-5-)-methyltransferase
LTKIVALSYREQLKTKEDLFLSKIKPPIDNFTVYHSPSEGYRTRIEFGLNKFDGELGYSMVKDGKKIQITELPSCHPKINELMKKTIAHINQDINFSKKLFQVEFQVSQKGESMITLIYHRYLDEEWGEKATILSALIESSIIGRSHKQCLIKGLNFVTEEYNTNKLKYELRLYEQCFSQTNPGICNDMLNWVEQNILTDGDLLELHCGLGTFTILFSKIFKKVLATENSRPSIKGLEQNLILNKSKNVSFARLSGQETLEALKGIREYRRLSNINLNNFDLSTVFLDPPRSGLDEETLLSVKDFQQIVYISCGFESLVRDLEYLKKSHKVCQTALFDQFPYTEHIESGVILRK